MSLDNTSQISRPRADELVPSRYVLRVGEIDVLVISDEALTPPAESIATNADPAVRAAWLDDRFLSRDAFEWALNEVVVRSGGQTILIDSGLGVLAPQSPAFLRRCAAVCVAASVGGDVHTLLQQPCARAL